MLFLCMHIVLLRVGMFSLLTIFCDFFIHSLTLATHIHSFLFLSLLLHFFPHLFVSFRFHPPHPASTTFYSNTFVLLVDAVVYNNDGGRDDGDDDVFFILLGSFFEYFCTIFTLHDDDDMPSNAILFSIFIVKIFSCIVSVCVLV